MLAAVASILRRLPWLGVVLTAVGVLGLIGHRRVQSPVDDEWFWDLYRTLRLFTVNLDVPTGRPVPAELFVAAYLAPLVLAGSVVATVSRRARDRWIRSGPVFAQRIVVVVGSTPTAVAFVEDALTEDAAATLLHDDPDPGAFLALRRAGARTLRVEPTSADLGRGRGVRRASEVVVTVEDDAAAAAAAERMAEASVAQVYAVFADQRGADLVARRQPRIVPVDLDHVVAAQHFAGTAPGEALVVVGDGPLACAVVREACRLVRRDRRTAEPVGVITVVGPRASDAVASVVRDVNHMHGLPALDPVDDDLSDAGAAIRALAATRAQEVVVADHRVTAGFALDLATGLRGKGRLTVLASRHVPFGAHVAARTSGDAGVATVEVTEVTRRAASLAALRRMTLTRRLEDAGTDVTALEEARKVGLDVRTGHLVSVGTAERHVLEALGVRDLDALEDAGVEVDLRTSSARERLVRKLCDDAQADAAFAVWCDIVHRTEDAGLTELRSSLERRADSAIRERVLRVADLRLALARERDPHDEHDPAVAATPPVVVVAGGAVASYGDRQDALERADAHLRFALDGFDGTLVSGGTPDGVPGLIGRIAEDLELHALGFPATSAPAHHPGYARQLPSGEEDSIEQALAAWEHAVADVTKGSCSWLDLRFLSLPGGDITWQEVALARALRVPAAYLPLTDEPQVVADRVFGGDSGVVTLIDDRATVRAFLRPSRWPRDEERIPLARSVHASYCLAHAARKPAGDPALAPWRALRDDLRRSNIAVVDDLPNKLSKLGYRLVASAEPRVDFELGSLDEPSQHVLLLAELEHGRFVAERLLGHWRSGIRDPGRRITPHLRPWNELSGDEQLWDIEIVLAALEGVVAAGWAVVRADFD